MKKGRLGKVSETPTNPKGGAKRNATREFDIASLYDGPAGSAVPAEASAEAGDATKLSEKLRQAYFWITNHAIISPYYDIEYEEGPSFSVTIGDQGHALKLPSGQSYSSFVLLPLLTLALRRKCLLIGGPGRGKTVSAVLMGILSGIPLKEVRRGIQHGQPQMTITDLLGNPLPADLVGAQSMDDIRIFWRKWLGMRVKIIDEYNRIPTRTQSALLTVMADNYAEMLDQVYECPDSAWYLTANDDEGGGTYQVIEALRDRIDVVVKALHFNTRFLPDLLQRIEDNIRPEDFVPDEIIFDEAEIDRMNEHIRAVRLPPPLRRRIEFFAAQFEFLDPAAEQFEYKTKDTAKLADVDYNQVSNRDTGKDRARDLGSQTKNGLSVRALMTVLAYIKAMAFLRGDDEVSLEDIRQMVPFVLHDKLAQDSNAPFFESENNAVYRTDRVGWLRTLFDESCAQFDRMNLDADDPLHVLEEEFQQGLEGVTETQVNKRLAAIEALLGEWAKARKLYGTMHDDLLKLKYLHQRYTNYRRWLRWQD